MKTILALICSLLFMSCGTAGPHQGDSELKGYIAAFESVALNVSKPIKVGNIDVDFEDDLEKYGAGVVGICVASPGETPFVRISKEYWVKSSDEDKTVLMFHELGHCVLNRGHWYLKDPWTGVPFSIMYPTILAAGIYNGNKQYYDKELFWNTIGTTDPSKKTHVCRPGNHLHSD